MSQDNATPISDPPPSPPPQKKNVRLPLLFFLSILLLFLPPAALTALAVGTYSVQGIFTGEEPWWVLTLGGVIAYFQSYMLAVPAYAASVIPAALAVICFRQEGVLNKQGVATLILLLVCGLWAGVSTYILRTLNVSGNLSNGDLIVPILSNSNEGVLRACMTYLAVLLGIQIRSGE